MVKRIVASVLSVAVIANVSARGEEPATSPSTQPAAPAAEIEAKLEAAMRRIEALEAEVASLRSAVADAATPPRDGGRPARPRAAARAVNAVPVLAKGVRLAGTFTNAAGNHAAKAVVLDSAKDRVVLRVTNEYGTRDWEVKVDGKAATLTSTRIVNTTTGNQLKSINVAGSIDGQSIKLAGNWIWQGPRGGGREDVRLELAVE